VALELPAGGAYDYTRSGFDAVRNALNEPSPALAEMLKALNSTEEGAKAETETPMAVDPVL
jgi:hypothetical protein